MDFDYEGREFDPLISNVSAWDRGLDMLRDYEFSEEVNGYFSVTPHFIHLGGYGLYRYLREVGELEQYQGFYRPIEDVDVLCVDNVGNNVQILFNETARTNPAFTFMDGSSIYPFRQIFHINTPGEVRVVFHHSNWRGIINYYRYNITPKPPFYRVLTRPTADFEGIKAAHPFDLFLLKLDVVNALQRRGDVYNHDLDLIVLLKYWVGSKLEPGESTASRINQIVRGIYSHFTSPTPIAEGHSLLLAFYSSLNRYLQYVIEDKLPLGFENIFPSYDEAYDLYSRVLQHVKIQIEL